MEITIGCRSAFLLVVVSKQASGCCMYWLKICCSTTVENRKTNQCVTDQWTCLFHVTMNLMWMWKETTKETCFCWLTVVPDTLAQRTKPFQHRLEPRSRVGTMSLLRRCRQMWAAARQWSGGRGDAAAARRYQSYVLVLLLGLHRTTSPFASDDDTGHKPTEVSVLLMWLHVAGTFKTAGGADTARISSSRDVQRLQPPW